jgi:Ca2+-binding RTX toxin-like protein
VGSGPSFQYCSEPTANDTVKALGANDIIEGMSGNDVLRGGSGADKVRGGGSADRLYGEAGNDELNSLDGGTGTDIKVIDATEKSIVGFP